MNRVHYEVNNLVNSTSKTQLKNALDKVEGVQNVCVDMARGTVEVIYSDEANESKVKNCIEDSGIQCRIIIIAVRILVQLLLVKAEFLN